jgi:hypothetical protein
VTEHGRRGADRGPQPDWQGWPDEKEPLRRRLTLPEVVGGQLELPDLGRVVVVGGWRSPGAFTHGGSWYLRVRAEDGQEATVNFGDELPEPIE